MSQAPLECIVSHLGGNEVLARIGASTLLVDEAHVSFSLNHANPKGVRSVVISTEPGGMFHMACYGPVDREPSRRRWSEPHDKSCRRTLQPCLAD
jgi:hypothetical protein